MTINSHNDNVISPFRKAYDKHLKIAGGHSDSTFNKKNIQQLGDCSNSNNNKQEVVLSKRFKLQIDLQNKKNKVGLYIGRDQLLNQDIAIKLFGGKKPKISKSQYQFFCNEKELLQKLRTHDGFSKMIESGYDEETDLYYIVMNKIDEDLNQIVKRAEGSKLSLQTVINVGLELIERLESLHQLGIVHRDLKPKNIMVNHSKNEIVLIDFGLSNKFMSQYQTHIQYRSTKKILGTPLYASNNALLGKEISRRDDIESLVYILIFALKGSLPWKGQLKLEFLKSPFAKEKIKEWRDPYGELCHDIEPEFREMLEYAQKLDFEEEPDYEYLESLLSVIKERNDFDDSFDWSNSKQAAKNHSTKIVIHTREKSINHEEIPQQDQNFLNLNMINKDLSQTMKKNVKYRTVRKLKKGASGTYNNNDESDLSVSKQNSQNKQSDLENNSKQNVLKVRRPQNSKKRVKISAKIDRMLLQSPIIIQTPDKTKLNSNDVSNNGDIMHEKLSHLSDNQPKSFDICQRSDSIKINFIEDHVDERNPRDSEDQNSIDDDLLVPSEEQNNASDLLLLNEMRDYSGTAGIDFNHLNTYSQKDQFQQYWEYDYLEEDQSNIKNVPEFNNKRTIIQRKSQRFESQDQNSPVRIKQMNSCTHLSQTIGNMDIQIHEKQY
eukprot:403374385